MKKLMGYDNQEHELKLVGLYIVWECYGEKGHFYDTWYVRVYSAHECTLKQKSWHKTV